MHLNALLWQKADWGGWGMLAALELDQTVMSTASQRHQTSLCGSNNYYIGPALR